MKNYSLDDIHLVGVIILSALMSYVMKNSKRFRFAGLMSLSLLSATVGWCQEIDYGQGTFGTTVIDGEYDYRSGFVSSGGGFTYSGGTQDFSQQPNNPYTASGNFWSENTSTYQEYTQNSQNYSLLPNGSFQTGASGTVNMGSNGTLFVAPRLNNPYSNYAIGEVFR